MQRLGVNTIRVYNVNPLANHDACMSIFNAAGIYVIIDVNTPQMSIDRTSPAGTYTTNYTSFIFSQVENFKGYPNTLAFHSANEVINDNTSATIDPPFLRAVTRDLKQYIAKHSSRHIPVGYSAADYRAVLADTWNYMQCSISGETEDSRSEFFGLNSYSWCGATATYTSAGYDTLVAMFTGTSIPVFFSEYGCNEPKGVPRVFNEVAALYGPDMTGLNGGLVYEYSEEPDDYGLVTISSTDGSITLRQDYVNLLGQFNKLDASLQTQVPSANNAAPVCSTSLVTGASGLSNNFTIPPQPPGTAELIANGVTGAINGKIVPVTSLDVTQKVYDVNGNAITGLALNQVTGSNVPSGKNLTSGSGNGGTTGGSSGGSGGKKSAGVSVRVQASGAGLAVLAVAMALFV